MGIPNHLPILPQTKCTNIAKPKRHNNPQKVPIGGQPRGSILQ